VKKLEPYGGIRICVWKWHCQPVDVSELNDERLHAREEGENMAAYLCYRKDSPFQLETFVRDMPRVRTLGIGHRFRVRGKNMEAL
jgi:hypothetical protein